MKAFLSSLFLVFLLTGCAGTTKYLETRVTCTVAKDEARADSKWIFFGISSPIADADAKLICK